MGALNREWGNILCSFFGGEKTKDSSPHQAFFGGQFAAQPSLAQAQAAWPFLGAKEWGKVVVEGGFK